MHGTIVQALPLCCSPVPAWCLDLLSTVVQRSVRNVNFTHQVCARCLKVISCRHRYGQGLTWTVLGMAEGTCTGEMPSFDLRACSEAKKRPFSSDGSESLFGMCCNVFSFLFLVLDYL